MFYYLYDEETSEIHAKSTTELTEGLWCKSNVDYDLDLYTVVVGMVDENKNLVYPQQKIKSAEQLVTQIEFMRQQQSEIDQAALDLDYRMTLLENNLEAGELK